MAQLGTDQGLVTRVVGHTTLRGRQSADWDHSHKRNRSIMADGQTATRRSIQARPSSSRESIHTCVCVSHSSFGTDRALDRRSGLTDLLVRDLSHSRFSLGGYFLKAFLSICLSLQSFSILLSLSMVWQAPPKFLLDRSRFRSQFPYFVLFNCTSSQPAKQQARVARSLPK
ncbi:hypothetical protein BKA81DRAFT_112256 [Phyllosticta paracitricarpa]